MEPNHQSRDLFKGAFILTLAALITKILSAIYRIPFQNIVGDVGFYIYQQVYPFYAMAVVLATTGFPVVISKLYNEVKEKEEPYGEQILLFVSFLFLQLVGLLLFLVIFKGADQIALWMHDPKLSLLLKVVSFVFLLFPLISLIRGFYQGKGNMIPTALSQVGEQSIRVITIIVLALLFTKKGLSLYIVGSGAMFGSITGSGVAVLILLALVWRGESWKKVKLDRRILKSMVHHSRWIIKALILQGLAICISGMLMIFLQMADALSLYSSLVSHGWEKEAAKSLKGIYDRGQPLIQLGTVAATSISLSLVPLITSERLKKNTRFLHHKISLSMQISLLIGIGASVGLWAIIKQTNMMLFENEQGSDVLAVLSFVIFFSSILSTLIAIMQGMGRMVFPAGMIAVSFPLKYFLNLFLVPEFGTMGAAISTLLTLAIISLAIVLRFKAMFAIKLFSNRYWRTITLALLAMLVFLKGYLFIGDYLWQGIFANNRMNAALQSVSAAFLGATLYAVIVIKGRIFSEEELLLFPFGSKFALLLPYKVRRQKNHEKN